MGLLSSDAKIIVGKSTLWQYENNIAPNGTFGTMSVPSVTTRANASCDVVLTFQYTQGSYPASGFLVFFNLTGAASLITDPAWLVNIQSSAGTYTYTVIIAGVNPSTHYSCAVAAFSVCSNGRAISALQAPSSWQNFQPSAAPEYSGNINGVAATMVTAQAANGQTAFYDTDQYRNNYPPTNGFSSLGYTVISSFVNNTAILQVNFSYSQGARIATHYAIYVKYGGGTISISDPHYLVSAGVGGSTFIFPMPIESDSTISFGIAALAVCKDGPAYNASLGSSLNQVMGNPVLGKTSVTTYIEGTFLINTYTVLDIYGKLDFNTHGGWLVPRRRADLTCSVGEFCWNDNGTYRGFQINDSANRLMHAVKSGDTLTTSTVSGHSHTISLDSIVREFANP
jgi:hypothetical protein